MSFLAGMIIFLNYPHLSTLVIFISIVMVIFGLTMITSPKKSPKFLGVLELLSLLLEEKKHGDWTVKIIRLFGFGLTATGFLFLAFVYNRIYNFTNSSNIIILALVIFIVFAAAENHIVSSYKKKKMK